jgi:hypothetical protein
MVKSIENAIRWGCMALPVSLLLVLLALLLATESAQSSTSAAPTQVPASRVFYQTDGNFPTQPGTVGTSSTGAVVIVVSDDQAWVSFDYGSTWQLSNSSVGYFTYIMTVSSSGQYAVIASTSSESDMAPIITSPDYGMTWNQASTTPNMTYHGAPRFGWTGLAGSSSGQYVTVCRPSAGVFVSTNYGVNWTTVPDTREQGGLDILWTNVAVSGTGQYMIGVGDVDFAIMSSTYGASWNILASLPSVACLSFVSISLTGQSLTATGCANNSPLSSMYTSNDYGSTWTTFTPMGLPRNLTVMGFVAASNASYVQMMMVTTSDVGGGGQLYVSNTSGAYWSEASLSPVTEDDAYFAWQSIASDYHGHNLLAFGEGGILYSTNPAATSRAPTSSPTPPTSAPTQLTASRTLYKSDKEFFYETTVGTSSTGSVVIAASEGSNSVSFDYGVTWQASTNSPSNPPFPGMAVSSSGQYVAVASGLLFGSSDTPPISVSKDYGITWTAITVNVTHISGGYPQEWTSIACSTTGQYMVATLQYYGVYVSTTYGMNWSLVATTGYPNYYDWADAAISGTGQYMAAVGAFSDLALMSSNYGASWSSISGIPTFTCLDFVSISLTGQYMTAVGCFSPIPIYQSNDYGVSWTSTTATGLPDNVFGTHYATAYNATQVQIMSLSDGALYVSNSSGVYWSAVTLSPAVTDDADIGWQSVASDYHGQNLVAFGGDGFDLYSTNAAVAGTSMPSVKPTLSPTVLTMAPSQHPSATPTRVPTTTTAPTAAPSLQATVFYQTNAPFMFQTVVGMSSNGAVVWAAGPSAVYVSQNYGSNWLQVPFPPFGPYISIAVTSSGEFAYMASEKSAVIVVYQGYGSGWTLAGSIPNATIGWLSVACSSDGAYVVASQAEGGAVYVSSNYGADWTLVAESATYVSTWYGVAMSGTGQYILAVGYSSGALIYPLLSMDSGSTWTQIMAINSACEYFATVSSSGQYMSVANCYESESGYASFWRSSNYGVTWTEVTLTSSGGLPLYSVPVSFAAAMDAPHVMILGLNNGYLYVSNSSGTSWQRPRPVPRGLSRTSGKVWR